MTFAGSSHKMPLILACGTCCAQNFVHGIFLNNCFVLVLPWPARLIGVWSFLRCSGTKSGTCCFFVAEREPSILDMFRKKKKTSETMQEKSLTTFFWPYDVPFCDSFEPSTFVAACNRHKGKGKEEKMHACVVSIVSRCATGHS